MLIISRKQGESFYVDDTLFTVQLVVEGLVILTDGVQGYIGYDKDCVPLEPATGLKMTLHIIRINGDKEKVFIGCEGPLSTVVLRKELVDRRSHD